MIELKHQGQGTIFYATKLSAGFDICANHDEVIPAGKWKLIRTGLFIVSSSNAELLQVGNESLWCVPEIQIRPRSGLAAKHGITVLNAPSTIDADYRGEIMINLINHGEQDFVISTGDRIAQGVCALSAQLNGIPVKDVERRDGGFGSSGKN